MQQVDQNNKLIKIDDGAIGHFDSKDALLKWTVSAPKIWEMLRDINSKLWDARWAIFQLHHKYTDAFEKTFGLKTLKVIEVSTSIGNSFLETV